MTKQDIQNELAGISGIRIRFYKVSRYMKARYKPEYVTPECWIYTGDTPHGYLVTEEDYNNDNSRKAIFDMIRGEARL
jgi:hypothetical protein